MRRGRDTCPSCGQSIYEEPNDDCEDFTRHEDPGEPDDPEDFDDIQFADPGGRSALRAATPDDPRVHPCPTCGSPNRLTQQDINLGYQCDSCADRAEGNYYGGDY